MQKICTRSLLHDGYACASGRSGGKKWDEVVQSDLDHINTHHF